MEDDARRGHPCASLRRIAARGHRHVASVVERAIQPAAKARAPRLEGVVAPAVSVCS